MPRKEKILSLLLTVGTLISGAVVSYETFFAGHLLSGLSKLCADENPSFLYFFDITTAPPLLFYSYIPIVLVGMFFGLFVFFQDKKSLQSKLLLLIATFFSLWIVDNLVEWVASYHTLLLYSWQIQLVFEVPIFIFSLYFLYVFIYKKDLQFKYKIILSLIAFLVLVLLPTGYNIQSYDDSNCEGKVGALWNAIYTIEIILTLAALLVGSVGYFSKKKKISKIEILLSTVGMVLFLGFFAFSNILGEITQVYQINLFGPIGMVFFLALLSYLIVRYSAFNAKAISVQVLVFTLSTLVFSLLFIEQINYIHLVVGFTLFLVIALGYSLIRGVKKEIEQRIKIEKLAKDLEGANIKLKELDKQKDELLGIIAHQLATPVSSVRWNLEMMMDGDMGKLTKEQSENVKSLQGITENLSDLVSMILDVSRIQLGRMRVDKQELDLNVFFKEILEIIEPKAKEKKIKFKVSMPKKFPIAMLDRRYTHMTIENLLSNAIKYTPSSGSVIFDVKIIGGNLFCTVKDTGVGIPEAEKDKIFGKMFRASNVQNTVDGNGFGLYVAKGATEAQGGKIWFESKENKGTTFFVKLPIGNLKNLKKKQVKS